MLCLITYAAVIGLFLISGAATSLPMLSLPRRARADLKVLVASPLAIALAVLWLGGAASTLAFFPREASSVAAAAAGDAGDGGQPQDQRSELERFMATAPRVPLIVPTDGAKVLIVKFADFQCPACGQAFLRLQADPGEIRRRRIPGRAVVHEGFSAEPGLQRDDANDAAHVGVRCGRRGAAGPCAQQGRGAGGVFLQQSDRHDARQPVRQAARDVGQVHRLRRPSTRPRSSW